jgi:hypothetical protein
MQKNRTIITFHARVACKISIEEKKIPLLEIYSMFTDMFTSDPGGGGQDQG